MISIIEKEKCTGCHACANECPKKCIDMIADTEGFLYPLVDESRCIHCNLCEKVCPVIEKNRTSNAPKAYAVINKNEEIRKESSSGGVFTLIAEYVLSNDGVVFGAAFDEDFNVKHILVYSYDDLNKLRGSKYLQSTIGDTYEQVKKLLDNNKMVYYTGTPCQIEGLLKYLKKGYSNLITQDIICHGVPSPRVWKDYLVFISNSKPKGVSFREKSNGWQNYNVNILFENGFEYNCPSSQDSYMKSFLKDYILRPSCYNCSFKDKIRSSDFTLADFWGIDNILPQMNDNRGTSLVFLNSKKSQEIFYKIKDKANFQEVGLDEAIKYNPAAVQSAKKPKGRDEFVRKINSSNFDKVVKKYCDPKLLIRVKQKLKRIAKRLLKK